MRQLLERVEAAIHDDPFTHRRVPLAWLRALDAFASCGRPSLALGEAAAGHVPLLLRFLNNMGDLLWIDKPALRGTAEGRGPACR